MVTMPMFPLGTVLLPGGALPLHVFEPRYRDMIRDCLRADGEPEFGQTLILHGWETGGGDDRAMVGTVARMFQVEALDDDRYSLVALGTRRIRVTAWLPDNPYPIADVEDWPDEDPRPADLERNVVAALDRVIEVRRLAARLAGGGHVASDGHLDSTERPEVSDDPVTATYHLAALAPIGSADRLRLLSAPGPAARLTALGEVLDDVEAMLKFRLS